MVNVTLSVSDELHKFMKKHKEVKWSEIARAAMISYAEKLKLIDKLTSKSKLDKEDAFELGELIKKEAWKKHSA